jgi:hypothetical protein
LTFLLFVRDIKLGIATSADLLFYSGEEGAKGVFPADQKLFFFVVVVSTYVSSQLRRVDGKEALIN